MCHFGIPIFLGMSSFGFTLSLNCHFMFWSPLVVKPLIPSPGSLWSHYNAFYCMHQHHHGRLQWLFLRLCFSWTSLKQFGVSRALVSQHIQLTSFHEGLWKRALWNLLRGLVSRAIFIFKTYHSVKTFNLTSVPMMKMRHSLNSMTLSSIKVKSLLDIMKTS